MTQFTLVKSKIADIVKNAGWCDEKGIIFLAKYCPSSLNILPNVKSVFGIGYNEEVCLFALNGKELNVTSKKPNPKKWTRLSIPCSQIKEVKFQDAGYFLDISFDTNEKLQIGIDKNNKAAIDELAKILKK